jgi:hypothetical protein
MIKRRYILLSFLLLTILQLQANPITELEALQLATNFHQLRSPSQLRSVDDLKLVWQGMGFGLRSASDPTLYIYNIGNNQGFVIVSGDDATKTILGYADEGSFQTEGMPENLAYWLNFYQQEIEAVRAASASATVTAEVSAIATGTTTVAPLLGGIKWNQTNPYNLLCPLDAYTNTHALAGCVAVAMGQIMKYYNWPVKGTGTHSYTDATYGYQYVDMSKTTYDWGNMLNSYVSGNTGKQDSAVATLIYQCGVAVDMAYSLTGSSSSISKAAEVFVNHFGYDSDIQKYDRLYYSNDEWNALMKHELDNARPVNYYANSDAGGHSFVCDGYDSNNLYHINWGWGGSSNGYFELSSLASNHPDVVGAAPEFCYFQSILANIHKVDALTKATNQVEVYKIGLSSSVSNVSKINTSSFTLSYCFGNNGANSVSVRWGIGYIKDGSSTITKLVENSSTTYTTIPAFNFYSTAKTFTISNPTGLATAGIYRLYPIYLPKDSVNWSIMRGNTSLNNCMVVTVASTNGPATILPALANPSLELTGAPTILSRVFQNKTINVDVPFKNKGQEFFSRVKLCLISTTNPNLLDTICESKINCPAGDSLTFHLSGSVSAPPGSYYLQVQFDSTNSNSTLNYKTFGPTNLNNQSTMVLIAPGPPVIQLNNLITLPNGMVVSKGETINLKATITNAGGFFDSRIIAFVFPKAGGRSLTFLTPKYVYLDSLETQEVSLSGAPDLEPGEYAFSIYCYQNNTWNLLTPGNLATIFFTVSDGSSVLLQTEESIKFHQDGMCLILETNADVQQSKLYDMTGRLILKTSAEKEILVGTLAPGVYLLQVQSNGKNYRERFLKQ